MGLIQCQRGLINEAIQLLYKLLSGNPHHSKALGTLGEILWSQGMVNEAAQLFESAVTHEPDYAHIWHHLAKLYSETQSWQQAFAAAFRAAQLEPERNLSWQRLKIIMPQVPTYLIDNTFLAFLETTVKSGNDRLRHVIFLVLQVLCATRSEFNHLLLHIHNNPDFVNSDYTLPHLTT